MFRSAVVLLLIACKHQSAALETHTDDALFIGWKGETYQAGTQKPNGTSTNKWIQLISWKPRAFIYHNLLTDEEADHIKRLAAPMMKRSTVVGQGGTNVLDDYRTSYGTFIKRKADPIIQSIEQRVAHWTRIPPINSEDMQVLRYGRGQQYKPHMDSLKDEEAGPRVCTVLMYLNNVPEGGETAFPESNHWVHPSLSKRLGPFTACANGSVAFRPKKGDALLFWSVHPDGKTEDHFSMHTGCPVVKGHKFVATIWTHGRPFRPETYGNTDPYEAIDPGVCDDYDPGCTGWAKAGECEKNLKFMVGDIGSAGRCPKACGTCTVCAPGNRKCYNDNRRKAGFLVYVEGDPDADLPQEY